MKEYTVKQMKLLAANPYTFKVTKHKLFFTIEFKETFWTSYQAGYAPRKILSDLGYDLEIFGQKQIDSNKITDGRVRIFTLDYPAFVAIWTFAQGT